MNKRTRAQKKAEWERAYDSEEFVEWGKLEPCIVCGRRGTPWAPNHNAHTRPVGELPSGTSRKADARWVLILCEKHHAESHAGEKSFAAKHNLDLPREAQEHWGEWICITEGLQ